MTAVAAVPEKPGKIKSFLQLVKIEHSIFALPFAYLSALVALDRLATGIHWLDLLLITIAMVAGRTFAMAANRILDRKIDALNPRTQGRELVTGAVSLRTAWSGASASLAGLFVAAALLNRPCLAPSPPPVVSLVLYPYPKSFSKLPHHALA